MQQLIETYEEQNKHFEKGDVYYDFPLSDNDKETFYVVIEWRWEIGSKFNLATSFYHNGLRRLGGNGKDEAK